MSYTISNHTKIKIISQNDGKETILLNTNEAWGDTITGNVVAGIPFIDVIDDSLDSFVFEVRNYPTRTAFAPFDLVEITVAEETMQMFVLMDNVKTYSRINNTYTHTISCVETTKYLEKIKIFNLCLTNKNDTLYRQFEKALVNAEPLHTTENFRFIFSEKLSNFLKNQKSRDFYFSNTDLRTVLDELLSVHNARVIVSYVEFINSKYLITLDYILMTTVQKTVPDWTLEEQGEIIYEEVNTDGQDYAGQILARGYNSIPEKPITVRLLPTSAEATLSDLSSTLMLPFPISDKGIKNLYVQTPVTYKLKNPEDATESGLYSKTVKIDLAGYFIPQEQYNLLSADAAKRKMPYQIGEKQINLGKAYKNWLGWTSLTIKNVIEQGLNDIEEDEIIIVSELEIQNLEFEIIYYPIYDTVAKISKEGKYSNNRLLMGIMDSQTEQTLDIRRHGKKLAGLIKRTGNEEYYVDVKAKYYSKLLPLMSKIDLPNATSDEEKDYVLYKREYAVYDNYINCRYYFSKDYNAVQKNAGVNRERHLYDIPLEHSETPLITKRKLKFSFNEPTENVEFDSNLSYSAVNTLIGSNKVIATDNIDYNGDLIYLSGQLKYLLFKSNVINVTGKDEVFPVDENEFFILPLGAYSLNKAMCFVAKPLDNYSVGYSRNGYEFSVWGDGGYRMSYNRYVSNAALYIGEASLFNLQYAFEYKLKLVEKEDGFEYQFVDLPQKMPIIILPKDKLYYATKSDIPFFYYKDRTQTPLFVLMLECLPAKEDYGNIIIGTEFARNNNLVQDNGNGLTGLKVYTSTDYRFNGDEDMLSASYINGGGEDVRTALRVETTNNGAKLTFDNKGNTEICSWAIADELGNIYLAVNDDGEKAIYVSVDNFPN